MLHEFLEDIYFAQLKKNIMRSLSFYHVDHQFKKLSRSIKKKKKNTKKVGITILIPQSNDMSHSFM